MSSKRDLNQARNQCDHSEFSKMYALLCKFTDIYTEIIQEITEFCVEICSKCKIEVDLCNETNCDQPIILTKCAELNKCGDYISKCKNCRSLPRICSICDNQIFDNLCYKCIRNEYEIINQHYKTDIFIKCQIRSSKYYDYDYELRERTRICDDNDKSFICIHCAYWHKCAVCHKIACSNCLRFCRSCSKFVCYDCSYGSRLNWNGCYRCNDSKKPSPPIYYFDAIYSE